MLHTQRGCLNSRSKGVFCYLDEKFRRLCSIPELGEFISF